MPKLYASSSRRGGGGRGVRCDAMDGLSRAGLGVMRCRACVGGVRFGGAVTLLAPTCTVLEVTCTCGSGLDLLTRLHTYAPHTRASAPPLSPSKLPVLSHRQGSSQRGTLKSRSKHGFRKLDLPTVPTRHHAPQGSALDSRTPLLSLPRTSTTCL